MGIVFAIIEAVIFGGGALLLTHGANKGPSVQADSKEKSATK
jgi:hypothetical protein